MCAVVWNEIPSLTPQTKVNSQWIKNQTPLPDDIHVLEEKINENGKTLDTSKVILYQISDAKVIKAQTDKGDSVSLRSHRTAKEISNKGKSQLTETIFANYATDRTGLISRKLNKTTQQLGCVCVEPD